LLEDERVRVLEMNLRAGDKDVRHSHPSETVYFITGSKVKIHLPDGQVVDADLPNGHAMARAMDYPAENAGDLTLRQLSKINGCRLLLARGGTPAHAATGMASERPEDSDGERYLVIAMAAGQREAAHCPGG
jgi:hypothetical protein